MSIFKALPKDKSQRNINRRWASMLFLSILAVQVAACSDSTASAFPATATVSTPPTSTPTPATATVQIASSIATAVPVAIPSPIPIHQLAESALGYLTYLVEELGPRESATQQELDGAEYLASQFEGFGYSVEMQPFTITSLSAELSELSINAQPDTLDESKDPQNTDVIPVIPLISSPEGKASGSLVAIGLAREGDLPQEGLAGKIALIQRGLIQFQEKVDRAAEAGALAAVIYSNIPGNFHGVMSSTPSIPALAISQLDGQTIEELLEAGEVTASVSVKGIFQTSHNVVATKPASGNSLFDHASVVLGGHYDTVPNVSGANDNSSGTAVVLALAEALAQDSLPFILRFISFGSEELGLVGSQHYVDSLTEDEKDGIIAMFNFDALGSGRATGVLGDVELTALAIEKAGEEGISVQAGRGLQGGGSDHMSFAQEGIPVLMFYGPDFSRIHTSSDTLEFVKPGLLGDAAGLALAILRSPYFLAVAE
ncbi:MAG TPA: M20/M25/M40 family metallo-hydrolase [Dehalococcoidia bacterium]|nr:M20/M25/M40 family metallo-hydrolase [Dehalococcoidia bacterium]